MGMDSNYYQTLKGRRDEKRKSAKEPEFIFGYFLPQLTTGRTLAGLGWDPLDVLKQGSWTWTRMGMSAILRGAQALGWEKWLNALEKRQQTGVTEAARDFRKELGLTGSGIGDVSVISAAGTAGCGFDWHRVTEQSENLMTGVADGCPMIQGAREMGFGNAPELELLSLWCDTYDNFETRATSPDVWFTHTHCQGRGDKLCKFLIDYRKDAQKTSWFATLKNLLDVKRKESPELEEYYAPGYWAPRAVEHWNQEKLYQLGVAIWRRITVAQVLVAAENIGMENWINGMTENEGPRIRQRIQEMGVKYGVVGSNALDASVLMHLGMMGCGFDDHQVTYFSSNQVEGVARTCPLVESAKELGMEDSLEEMSLWCDACRNYEVSAINKDITCTFTHCLARGDKLCRWIIE